MKALFNKSKCILIFVIMLFTLNVYTVPVKADSSSNTGFDVIFLLDASGSMKKSDPEQLRSEAIKLFLDMSKVQGSKFGLVAYSDSIVREHSLDSIASQADKDNLKNMTEGIPFGEKTDTGLGLSEAVKLMENGHDSSHTPVIILLSDGKNDPKRSSADSVKDIHNAIELAKAKGYPIYTIGLNYDGTVDKAQLSDISTNTGGKNYITNSSKDLTSILTDIYANINNSNVNQGGTLLANGDFQEFKINIPDDSIAEANISMLSNNPVEVKLSDNKGKEVIFPSEQANLTTSKKYSELKLIKPSKGNWLLKVKGMSGDKIDISYVFSAKSSVKTNTSVNKNVNTTSKTQNLGLYAAAAAIIAVLLAIVIFVLIKGKKKKGFGRIKLEIKDEKTQETMEPQYKVLEGYIDKFSLYELLGLNEEFSEADQLYFKFGNDTLFLDNKSKCVVQRSGRIIGKDERLQLTNGERIVAFLVKASKSVVIEFFAE